jgi:hypothetical protein
MFPCGPARPETNVRQRKNRGENLCTCRGDRFERRLTGRILGSAKSSRCFSKNTASISSFVVAGKRRPHCKKTVTPGRYGLFSGPRLAAMYLELGEVEAIQVHHFGPRGDEVVRELFLRVALCVDF